MERVMSSIGELIVPSAAEMAQAASANSLHDINSLPPCSNLTLVVQFLKESTKSPDISSSGRLEDERQRRARGILGRRANHESVVMELSEYMLETLRKDGNFILYRGRHRRETDTSPPSILVVAPGSERPTLESLRRMEHEYSFAAELDPSWASRPLALSQHNGQMVLVLENPGGEPLDRLIQGPMETAQFLRFAAGLATALSRLHQRGLIHKDVKPSNVLANSATGEVWLMGFGIASRLPRERQSPGPPEFIAGTLAYMAPEQTGRMNRSIDSRSDLYALGVTLYEMLTGSLPFMASDPMEWVHCHIARQPTPPGERAAVPEPLSAIIMKLLAKNAEERYQTASGLGSDLRWCLAQWETD